MIVGKTTARKLDGDDPRRMMDLPSDPPGG
jgi:hypothetical protein